MVPIIVSTGVGESPIAGKENKEKPTSIMKTVNFFTPLSLYQNYQFSKRSPASKIPVAGTWLVLSHFCRTNTLKQTQKFLINLNPTYN
jgi:hypothetical protein